MLKRRRFLQTLGATTLRVPRRAPSRPWAGPDAPEREAEHRGDRHRRAGGRRAPRHGGREHRRALRRRLRTRPAGTFNAFPKAERFRDYRVLLDKRKDIDAVMIATPDHMHAPITLAALRAGKHVYVEKPMAHSIEEARVMTRVARETGLVTQMGNNGHAGEGLRLTREWLQAGAVGPVREIHCWSDRPGKWWVQDLDRPDRDAPRPPRTRLGPLHRRRADAAV